MVNFFFSGSGGSFKENCKLQSHKKPSFLPLEYLHVLVPRQRLLFFTFFWGGGGGTYPCSHLLFALYITNG